MGEDTIKVIDGRKYGSKDDFVENILRFCDGLEAYIAQVDVYMDRRALEDLRKTSASLRRIAGIHERSEVEKFPEEYAWLIADYIQYVILSEDDDLVARMLEMLGYQLGHFWQIGFIMGADWATFGTPPEIPSGDTDDRG